ncbi:membrane protein [Pusillibacter faecalis]|uniref:Membrane protein n=1 Tax=Pusillibacter faecalis TaxID=2714358 RepID=A0A810QA27_9FIRM|nr:ECF transporter S component [Pusillibacter faecalis]BCK83107.1 membrane protein [Pusillibacter faecalis]
MSSIKKICLCAICTALCYVLPLAFHPLVMGTALSPMHIPVLLCGLLCGWPYGAFCGVVGPLLSSLLSGMPPAAMLLYMIPELCVYGLFSGLLLKWFRTGHAYADLYLALVPAMLLGRIAGGIARAIFYLPSGQPYSLALWTSSYLVGTLPGIILHLVILPPLVLLMMKARLIPQRYVSTLS